MPDVPDLTILVGDCRETLAGLADESVHCCVTSPPYFGLRDYGTATWEGGDAECDHTARSDAARTSSRLGAKGDSGPYLASAATQGGAVPRGDCSRCGARRIDSQIGLEPTPDEYVAQLVARVGTAQPIPLRPKGGGSRSGHQSVTFPPRPRVHGAKPKDLLGIPWLVAFALRADGWWLRQEIIWSKTAPCPSRSATAAPVRTSRSSC